MLVGVAQQLSSGPAPALASQYFLTAPGVDKVMLCRTYLGPAVLRRWGHSVT